MPRDPSYNQVKGFCITVDERDMDNFVRWANSALCDEFIDLCIIGDERNKRDRPHGQTYLETTSPMSRIELKKVLNAADCRSAHIEKREGPRNRAGNYCLKEHYPHIAAMFPDSGTVEELYRPGSKPLLVVGWDIDNACAEEAKQGKRKDIDVFKANVKAGHCPSWDVAMDMHSGLCARAEGFVRQYITRYTPIVPMTADEWRTIKEQGMVPFWFAEFLLPHLLHPNRDYQFRTVGTVEDCIRHGGTGGNSFKSFWAESIPPLFAVIDKKVQCMGPGKLSDMAIQLNADTHIVLIDVPQSRSDNLQFSFLEQLKGGSVDCPKYYSCRVRMNNKPIPVAVLCNEHPAHNQSILYQSNKHDPEVEDAVKRQGRHLSNDRWKRYSILSDADVLSQPNFLLPTKDSDGNPLWPVEFNDGVELSLDEWNGRFNELTELDYKSIKYAHPSFREAQEIQLNFGITVDPRTMIHPLIRTSSSEQPANGPPPLLRDAVASVSSERPSEPLKGFDKLFGSHRRKMKFTGDGIPMIIFNAQNHWQILMSDIEIDKWVSLYNYHGQEPRIKYDTEKREYIFSIPELGSDILNSSGEDSKPAAKRARLG